MKKIAKMFNKLYEKSKFKKEANIKNYDIIKEKFFISLTKEQFSMFLEIESKYLDYSSICTEKAIEFMLTTLIDD